MLGNNEADIKAVITARDEASTVLSKFGDNVDSLGNKVAAGFATAAKVTAVAGAAALAFGVTSVKAYNESEQAIAQTNAVLRSTGGIAGVTSDQVTKLATSLQKSTKFSDEQVRSAENLLLTFTSIGKDIFPQATATVLDMATALGEDTKSASIQLGKALQDPILGITALRRVGVNFSDAQKKVIEDLVNTGHKAEAQKLILKELNTEFGGSAKAAGDTFAGALAKLGNQFNDLQETVGKTIVQALTPLVAGFASFIATINEAGGIMRFMNLEMQKHGVIVAAVAGAILGVLVPGILALGASIWTALAPLLPFIAAGTALGLAVNYLAEKVGGWSVLMNGLSNALSQAGAVLNQWLTPAISSLWATITNSLLPALDSAYTRIAPLLTPAVITLAQQIAGTLVVAMWALVNVLNVLAASSSTAISYISSMINWLNSLGLIGRAVLSGLGGSFVALASSISPIIGLLENVVRLVQAAREGVNTFKSVGKSLHIPGFASGVTNFSGGMAVVGERGPELVNLPRGSDVIPNSSLPISSGGSTPTIFNITVQAGAFMGNPQDARQYAKLILGAMQDVASSKGMDFDQLWRHNGVRTI